MSRAQRLALIEPQALGISLRRQCRLLSVSRSSVYHTRQDLLPFDLELMRLIDEEHLRTPVYGSRRMTTHLKRLGIR